MHHNTGRAQRRDAIEIASVECLKEPVNDGLVCFG
jgi:hypothetical protein